MTPKWHIFCNNFLTTEPFSLNLAAFDAPYSITLATTSSQSLSHHVSSRWGQMYPKKGHVEEAKFSTCPEVLLHDYWCYSHVTCVIRCAFVRAKTVCNRIKAPSNSVNVVGHDMRFFGHFPNGPISRPGLPPGPLTPLDMVPRLIRCVLTRSITVWSNKIYLGIVQNWCAKKSILTIFPTSKTPFQKWRPYFASHGFYNLTQSKCTPTRFLTWALT